MADDKKQQDNIRTAGLVGAAIGAGVTLAATKVLADEKLKKKMMDSGKELKGKVTDFLAPVKDEIEDMEKTIKKQKEKAEK